jgi:uncharacterized membrane protein YfcA
MSESRDSLWVAKVISGGRVRRRSSTIGWLFWISVFLTVIPFSVLFGAWVVWSTHENIRWWLWVLAIPMGLMPAMIVGLIVEATRSIWIAAQRKRFDWFDAMFVLLLLILCAGIGVLYWRFDERLEPFLRFFTILIIVPLMGCYIHKRALGFSQVG